MTTSPDPQTHDAAAEPAADDDANASVAGEEDPGAALDTQEVALVASVVPCMLKSSDNPDGTERAVFDEMAAQVREDRAKFFSGFFKDFFGVGLLSHPVNAELIDWARGQALQASLRATLECARSFGSTDFRGDLEAFRVPTLIVHSTLQSTRARRMGCSPPTSTA